MIDSTWGLALGGAVLLWAAFAPLDWGLLGWVAPVAWLRLAERPRLEGRWPWLAIWAGGFVFWLLSVEWLRHAHLGAGLAAPVLAAYLACYVSGFLWLTRVAVHRRGIPLVVAAPLVWMALDLARGHMLGGFTLSSLAHTQHRWLALLQVADLVGAYGLGGLMILLSAGLTGALPGPGRRARWKPLIPGLLLVALACGYGWWRLEPEASGSIRVGLVQGATPTEVKHDPARHEQVWREYFGLSRQAAAENPRPDLLIWPETMFREPLFTWEEDVAPPPGADWDVELLKSNATYTRELLGDTARALGTPVLVGLDVIHFGAGWRKIYNSAVEVDADGRMLGRYDKMHPVLFGETIPLGSYFPSLYEWLPVPQGIEVGQRHTAFPVGNLRASVNICYECLVPHLLRQQLAELSARGEEPDLLINLTNNGYYGGSAELDGLLVSARLRAIELRKPMLVAANCGFSAWIDGDGRLRAVGPRQQQAVVWAQPVADRRTSPYRVAGDWLPGLALLCSAVLAGGEVRRSRRGGDSEVPE